MVFASLPLLDVSTEGWIFTKARKSWLKTPTDIPVCSMKREGQAIQMPMCVPHRDHTYQVHHHNQHIFCLSFFLPFSSCNFHEADLYSFSQSSSKLCACYIVNTSVTPTHQMLEQLEKKKKKSFRQALIKKKRNLCKQRVSER